MSRLLRSGAGPVASLAREPRAATRRSRRGRMRDRQAGGLRDAASDRRRAGLAATVAAALLAALSLVALRVEILRVRYDLARVHSEERALLDQQRVLTAEVGRLRDPARLRRLAAERGFARPERVIHLAPEDRENAS